MDEQIFEQQLDFLNFHSLCRRKTGYCPPRTPQSMCIIFLSVLALSYFEDGEGPSNWHLMLFVDPTSDEVLTLDALSIYRQAWY